MQLKSLAIALHVINSEHGAICEKRAVVTGCLIALGLVFVRTWVTLFLSSLMATQEMIFLFPPRHSPMIAG